jgi:hypothetical protein
MTLCLMLFVERRHAECHCASCRYSECHNVGSRCANCRSCLSRAFTNQSSNHRVALNNDGCLKGSDHRNDRAP